MNKLKLWGNQLKSWVLKSAVHGIHRMMENLNVFGKMVFAIDSEVMERINNLCLGGLHIWLVETQVSSLRRCAMRGTQESVAAQLYRGSSKEHAEPM